MVNAPDLTLNIKKIPNVSETMLAVLLARAGETLSRNPLVLDPYSVEIVEAIQKVRKLKIPKKLNVSIGLRTKAFDEYIQRFLKENPSGIVINLGCGLDTRFFRLDNQQVEWYDIDFPEVIEMRKAFFTESSRYHMIGTSILDFRWFNIIIPRLPCAVLIYAEGVFMYLKEEEVKALIIHLIESFPKAHLVFENCDKYWVDKIQTSKYLQFKFRVRFKWDKDVIFHWGLANSLDLASWHPRLQFVDENIYLTQHLEKWGWMRFFLKNPRLARTMWIIHYTFH